ncbi:MAG TPA: nitroreductase family protein [Bacteroidales bacterium]|nr:nitroreductase family protein [Bacteroidales bacterium]
MEYLDLIQSRESVRSYDPDRQLTRETLLRIVEAGRSAPSACNNQPWKFVVICSGDILEKVRGSYHREWFKKAPHILIVKGFCNRSWKRISDGYNSIETDLAIAMTHIILAAANEGVGTCWIANFNPDILSKALDLKDDEVVFGITPLGYPEKGYQHTLKKRKTIDDVLEFI